MRSKERTPLLDQGMFGRRAGTLPLRWTNESRIRQRRRSGSSFLGRTALLMPVGGVDRWAFVFFALRGSDLGFSSEISCSVGGPSLLDLNSGIGQFRAPRCGAS